MQLKLTKIEYFMKFELLKCLLVVIGVTHVEAQQHSQAPLEYP